MSTTVELAKVLTRENRDQLLAHFFGPSTREARDVVAELIPRVAPTRSPSPSEASRAYTYSGSLLTSEVTPTHPARDAAPRYIVEPLAADLRRLHVMVDRQFPKRLDAAHGAPLALHPPRQRGARKNSG